MSFALASNSLAGRLSARLALQSLLGLALVSTLVFVAIDVHLRHGQTTRLAEMRALVEHLVEEAGPGSGPEEVEHLLEDVFAGHADFGLELLGADGRSLLSPTARTGLVMPDGSSAFDHDDVRTDVFTLAATGADPVQARLSLHTRRDQALLARLGLTLLAGVLLGTLINSAAASWRVRRDLAPVRGLARQIDALDATTLEHRIDDTGQPLELQPLVARFNDLLDRLHASYRQMASFNADVAHELNTPLATMTTSNEIALRNETDVDRLRELLGSNLEELGRLAGIVRDMLFLSTAERGARARTTWVSSLAEEVRGVIDYHEAVLEEAELVVEITGDASARVDRRLLRRALSNLIANATHHATPGSVVDVHVGPDRGEGDEAISLLVSNVGETIPAEHLPRLFERFYRVAPGRTERTASGDGGTAAARHGLGLSIVAAIARMHGGRTLARSGDGLTSIGVVLPRSSPEGRR